MYILVSFWTVLLLAMYGIQTGNSLSDRESCILENRIDGALMKTEFCVASKDDIDITCHRNELIVLNSLKFGVKQSSDICTKRILAKSDAICCRLQDNDAQYDAGCLQDVWSADDNKQYRQFMQGALRKCMNTHYCSLGWQVFSNLQRQIPRTRKYASYMQVQHKCLQAPVDPINICSSASKKGETIHIQGGLMSGTKSNKNCSCRVTSQSPVTVRAVDVRTFNSRLVLSSDNRVKDITTEQLPMFGLREIFTGRTFEISLQKVSDNTVGYMWLHLSGYRQGTISIVCGDLTSTGRVQSTETVARDSNTPRSPGWVRTTSKKSGFSGYGLMLYAAVGSGLTILLTICIFGGYFICRYCMKKGRHSYEKPYDRQFSGQYDAVYNGMPHPPAEWMNTGVKQDQRTSAMRSLHKPMAPTLPPPNNQGRQLDEATSGVSGMDVFFQN